MKETPPPTLDLDPESDRAIDPGVDALLKMARAFLNRDHSLFAALNLEPVRMTRGKAAYSLFLPQEFADSAGNVHGGLATIVLDSIFGLTVFTAMKEFKPIATINLRTDLVARTRCGERAICACACEAVRGDVAYVTGRLTRARDGALIALGAGSFMVGANSRRNNAQKDSRL